MVELDHLPRRQIHEVGDRQERPVQTDLQRHAGFVQQANFWRVSGSSDIPGRFLPDSGTGCVEKRLRSRDLQHAGVFAAAQIEGQADQG